MEKDYQRDAIRAFLRGYTVLHESFKLAIVEAFEKEFAAKAFCVMRPEMRRKWVKQQLVRRKQSLCEVEFDTDRFDALMDSVEWSGEGDLVLKPRMEMGMEE